MLIYEKNISVITACMDSVHTSGTQFLFAVGETPDDLDDFNNTNIIELIVTSKTNVPVNVTVITPKFHNPHFIENVIIQPHGCERISVSEDYIVEGIGHSNKTFYVESTGDVTVNVVCVTTFCRESFVVYPVKLLGYEYILASDERHGQTQLAGIVDSTTVIITMPNSASFKPFDYNGDVYRNGSILTIRLDRWEVFQFKSGGDITGTVVKADRPIAVFSGSLRSNSTNNVCGNMAEMLLDTSLWGNYYVISPNPNREDAYVSRDNLVVIGKESDTVISSYGSHVPKTTMSRGESISIHILTNEAVVIEVSKPAMVVRFVESDVEELNITFTSMDLILPPSYWMKDNFEFSAKSDGNCSRTIAIVINSSDTSLANLDGDPLDFVNWTSVSETNLVYGYFEESNSTKTLSFISPPYFFSAFSYDHNCNVSTRGQTSNANSFSVKCGSTMITKYHAVDDRDYLSREKPLVMTSAGSELNCMMLCHGISRCEGVIFREGGALNCGLITPGIGTISSFDGKAFFAFFN